MIYSKKKKPKKMNSINYVEWVFFLSKEARCNYKITFTEASQRLAQAAEKRRKQIQRARAYFELKEEAKRVRIQVLFIVVNFADFMGTPYSKIHNFVFRPRVSRSKLPVSTSQPSVCTALPRKP